MMDKELQQIYICAIRYCMGRKSYMPSIVVNYIIPKLKDLDTNTIRVMLEDCKDQEDTENWGNEYIDKPLWLNWGKELSKEYNSRY